MTDQRSSTRHEVPLHVRIYPSRKGGPRLAKNCRPAPGQAITLDLGSIRVTSRLLLELALEVTSQAPTITVTGDVDHVRDLVEYFLRTTSRARVLTTEEDHRHAD